MLTRIRNAAAVGHESTTIPYSNMKMAVAKVLAEEGYIGEVQRRGKKVAKVIEVSLKYNAQKKSRIRGTEMVSKPSRRMYAGVKDIHPIRGGYGTMILSTPKGILTGRQAKKEQVGGEVLFKIW